MNLVGYCADKGQHMLLYAYMPNGSLASHLYGMFSSCDPMSSLMIVIIMAYLCLDDGWLCDITKPIQAGCFKII